MLRLMALGLTLLCGCAHTVCTFQAAFGECKRRGSRGAPIDYSVGAECTEPGERTAFHEGCDNGHALGHYWHCDMARIRKMGHDTGAAGGPKSFSASEFQGCTDPNPTLLAAAYDEDYRLGVAEYCSLDRVFRLGSAAGLKGEKPAFSPGEYAVCGLQQLARVRESYDRGVDDGLRRYCAFPGLEDVGREDGRNGRSRSLDDLVAHCNDTERRYAAMRYQAAQQQGDQERCEQLPLEKEAAQAAGNGPELVLPRDPELQRCLAQYAHLKQRFDAAFFTERKRIIATNCTVERGLKDGRGDASSTLTPQTMVPRFCDSSAFSLYMKGYSDGWRQGKDAICDVDHAYQAGIKDGVQGSESSYTPPRLCPPDRHGELQGMYEKGRDEGTLKTFCSADQAYLEGVKQGESALTSGQEADYAPPARCPRGRGTMMERAYREGVLAGRRRLETQRAQADGDDDS